MSDYAFKKLFNLKSSETVDKADKLGLIEKQDNSIVGMDISTKEEFNGKTFIKKARLTFGKINLNLW